MKKEPKELFRIAAERASQRPAFLGWVLAHYVSRSHATPQSLAAELGVSEKQMNNLALCLRPRPERFAQDIDAIATKFSVDRLALARIVRHVEAVARLVQDAESGSGMLLAARRRTTPEGKRDDEPAR